jgi:hypothetical protein
MNDYLVFGGLGFSCGPRGTRRTPGAENPVNGDLAELARLLAYAAKKAAT